MAERKPFDKSTSYISEERKKELSALIASNEPKTDEELLVLVAHDVLQRNDFQVVCVGRYRDDQDPSFSQRESCLPDGWNKQNDPECYEFSYINNQNQSIYDFKGLLIEDKLCFTLLERGKHYTKASQVQIIVNDHVVRKSKPISFEWLNDPGYLWKLIEKGLFGKHEDLLEKSKHARAYCPKHHSETRLQGLASAHSRFYVANGGAHPELRLARYLKA